MKCFFKILVCSIVFLAMSLSLLAQADTLTILHVNDSHSCLAPLGPREEDLSGTQGGIARLASVVGQISMEDPNVLKLHAGDFFIGDMFFNMFFGVPELQILHSLGFDAMAVGNHEFDLTPETLYGALATAFAEGGFPLLSANLILDDPGVEGLQDFIFPYTTVEKGNIKVGIFGLTTPEAELLSQPDPAEFITDIEEILGISGAMVEQLYSEECDVVICLSHMGLYADMMIATYIPGIHLIVGGHSHDLLLEPYTPPGSNTMIVQVGAFYTHAGKIQLTVEDGQVDLLNYEVIHLDSSIPEEPTIAGTVDYLISEIEAIYGPVYSEQIIGADEYFNEVPEDLFIAGYKDTPIGNLVTDAFRAATETEIAMEACGSTAHPIYPGPLVPADLFRVVGYGFNLDNGLGYRLATLDITGAGLLAGLEFGLSEIELTYDYFIQVSGMIYSYDPYAEPFSRIDISSVYINGEPIDPEATYTVTANEFVLMFLDYLGIGYTNPNIYTALSEFEVLAGYVSQFDTISPYVEGRIQCVPSVYADDPVITPEHELRGNYPNPFNPTTSIEYSLTKDTHVSIVVYNLKGQKVKTLVNKDMEEGRHTMIWNGTDENNSRVTSGIYLYKLKAGGFQQTRKMILLK